MPVAGLVTGYEPMTAGYVDIFANMVIFTLVSLFYIAGRDFRGNARPAVKNRRNRELRQLPA
jgi:hypothetical protein